MDNASAPAQQNALLAPGNPSERPASKRLSSHPSRNGTNSKVQGQANDHLSPLLGGDVLPGIHSAQRRDEAQSVSSSPLKARHNLWPQASKPTTIRGLAGLDNWGGAAGRVSDDTPSEHQRRNSRSNRKISLHIKTEDQNGEFGGTSLLSPVRDEGVTTPRTSRPPTFQQAPEKNSSPRSTRSANRPLTSPARGSPRKAPTPVHPPRPTVQLNPRRLYRLMATNGGKMQGDLWIWQKEFQCWQPAYCSVDITAGCFMQESTNGRPDRVALVPDMRGCHAKAAFDRETEARMLVVTPAAGGAGSTVRLRPENDAEFDEWFAAFLCWQPVKPKQPLHSTNSRWIPKILDWSADTTAKALGSETSGRKAAAIKAGELSFLDFDELSSPYPQSSTLEGFRPPSATRKHWIKVYCILQQNGEFSLSRAGSLDPVARIDLSRFPRSAVQRLSPSVSGLEFGIAIHPQYSRSDDACSQLRPLFLALETRPLFEAWYVLLRAMANPVLYGAARPSSVESLQPFAFLPGISQQTTEPDVIRIGSPVSIRIMSARLRLPQRASGLNIEHGGAEEDKNASRRALDYYVEIVHDGQIKARTSAKAEDSTPAWHEAFDFQDWPTASSCVTIRINTQPSMRAVGNGAAPSSLDAFASPKLGSAATDSSVFAEATLNLDEISESKELNSWWPIVGSQGVNVGELMLEIKASRDVILMDKDFKELSDLIHTFTNVLTIQIAERIPYALSKLSECLLNIYQISGHAADWLMSLAEEEIDGVLKESPASRMRFNTRLDSDEKLESIGAFGFSGERETFVRDLGKSVTQEANLLFRGNTIFSKALDLHMKRLGKEYLEETLGPTLRSLNEQDLNCEVDPNKFKGSLEIEAELLRNWKRLISLTEDVWRAIYRSAELCPQELRMIFRHIRACADDRYGDFQRSVSYSSVSGFLFLRFFCAAILNPNMFGLVKAQPKSRAKRTFTLVAKSLQGLANMTTFGSKEPWMEPMNSFLLSHRREFKDFIDSVCSIGPSATANLPVIPPPYSTPWAMYSRVPAAVREGYLYLPYLICATANCTALVNVWLDNYDAGRRSTDATTAAATTTTTNQSSMSPRPSHPLAGDLLLFHRACVALRSRAESLHAAVERTEHVSSPTTQRWVALAERLEAHPELFLADEWELAADEQQYVSAAGRVLPRRRSVSTPPSTLMMRGSVEENRTLQSARDTLSRKGSDAELCSGASSETEQTGAGVAAAKGKEKGDKSVLGIFGWRKKAPSHAAR